MDVFPATVLLPDADRRLTKVFLAIRGERLVVLSEATGRITKIRDTMVIDRDPVSTSWGAVGWRISTTEGDIEVAREGGCGCSSRLKSARVEDYL